jgi:hypothetical protein
MCPQIKSLPLWCQISALDVGLYHTVRDLAGWAAA